jgi:hypothetical protein
MRRALVRFTFVSAFGASLVLTTTQHAQSHNGSPGNTTYTATICHTNDAVNDYYAVVISDLMADAADRVYILFDNSHDGSLVTDLFGKDALGFDDGFGLHGWVAGGAGKEALDRLL